MRRVLNIVSGVGFGLLLSQFPEFTQQYHQRLGGAVDELATIAADFDRTASDNGLTRDQALARFGQQSDTFLSSRGNDMTATFVRYERLSNHLAQLESASPLQRLGGFTRYYDTEIGARTADLYRPAVPITLEGFTYSGLGLLAGYGLMGLLLMPFGRRSRTRST